MWPVGVGRTFPNIEYNKCFLWLFFEQSALRPRALPPPWCSFAPLNRVNQVNETESVQSLMLGV